MGLRGLRWLRGWWLLRLQGLQQMHGSRGREGCGAGAAMIAVVAWIVGVRLGWLPGLQALRGGDMEKA